MSHFLKGATAVYNNGYYWKRHIVREEDSAFGQNAGIVTMLCGEQYHRDFLKDMVSVKPFACLECNSATSGQRKAA